MSDQLYAFAFRGFLSERALESTGLVTRLRHSKEDEMALAKRVGLDLLDPDFVIPALRMSTVYTAIAAFENIVRDFVVRTLLESHGANWWEETVSEKIRVRAVSRRDEEAKVRWHTPRGDQLLNYTEFGDLTSIIIQNWDNFEVHLRDQNWVRHIVGTLERSRNVIMHSGELANSDLERIGTVIRDWVAQVGA